MNQALKDDLEFEANLQRTTDWIKAEISSLGQLGHTTNVLGNSVILEKWLESILLVNMRLLSKRLYEQLFEGYGPINSFSSKIDLCFAFKFIEEDTRDELLNLKRIRNSFAHPQSPTSFDNEKIKLICRQLKPYKKGRDDFFEVYKEAVQMMVMTLSDCAKDRAPPSSGKEQ